MSTATRENNPSPAKGGLDRLIVKSSKASKFISVFVLLLVATNIAVVVLLGLLVRRATQLHDMLYHGRATVAIYVAGDDGLPITVYDDETLPVYVMGEYTY